MAGRKGRVEAWVRAHDLHLASLSLRMECREALRYRSQSPNAHYLAPSCSRVRLGYRRCLCVVRKICLFRSNSRSIAFKMNR